MPDCHITLFIPGLLGPQPVLARLPDAELPDLGLLETLLGRARISPSPIRDNYTGLFMLFAIAPDAQGEYPAAAVRQQAHGLQLSGDCLLADPVFLQADLHSAVARAHLELQLEVEEADQLVAAINAHLSGEGLELIMAGPHHWYLQVHSAQALQTTPLQDVLGCDIQPHLPRGEHGRYWRQLMNELQMLLHQHPVNLQREARGRLPVNSLWFAGYGRLPQPVPVPWQKVYSDDLLVEGLARLHGVHSDDLPQTLDEVLVDCRGEVLLVIQDCMTPLRQQDLFGWLEEVRQIQALWLQPLQQALRSGRCGSLTLLPGNGRQYRIQRADLRRWWRRSPRFKTRVLSHGQ